MTFFLLFQMMRKTPQKMDRTNSSHDDVQYHRMTAQNDGFVDMQVHLKKK